MSFENAGVSVYEDDKLIYKDSGETLFTHFGISGPVILHMSSTIYEVLSSGKKVFLLIDFKPLMDSAELEALFQEECKNNPVKKISTALKEFVPARLVKRILEAVGVDKNKRLAQVSKEEKRRLVEKLKGFKLIVESVRPIQEAMITCGGVSVKEINPKTMESNIIKGLYFADRKSVV